MTKNAEVYLIYIYIYIYIYKGGILFNRTTSKIMQAFRIVMKTNSFNFMHCRRSFASFSTGTISVNELLILVTLQKLNNEPLSLLSEHTECCVVSKWEIALGLKAVGAYVSHSPSSLSQCKNA